MTFVTISGAFSRRVRRRVIVTNDALEAAYSLYAPFGMACEHNRRGVSQLKKGGRIVRNGEGRGGLLESGYDGLKLELEATEHDIKKLQVRADKLRAVVAALQDLVPGRNPVPTNGAADDAASPVWLKQGAAV